jgi:hypothetical protein
MIRGIMRYEIPPSYLELLTSMQEEIQVKDTLLEEQRRKIDQLTKEIAIQKRKVQKICDVN